MEKIISRQASKAAKGPDPCYGRRVAFGPPRPRSGPVPRASSLHRPSSRVLAAGARRPPSACVLHPSVLLGCVSPPPPRGERRRRRTIYFASLRGLTSSTYVKYASGVASLGWLRIWPTGVGTPPSRPNGLTGERSGGGLLGGARPRSVRFSSALPKAPLSSNVVPPPRALLGAEPALRPSQWRPSSDRPHPWRTCARRPTGPSFAKRWRGPE